MQYFPERITSLEIKPIAYIRTDFPEKFGIPCQSNLIKGLIGRIIFEPEFRNPDALRGLRGFSHMWLLWEFEGVKREAFHATVRPPRLGGSERVGVFASRSPFRPNPIGLSCVRLIDIEDDDKSGPVLVVEGADLRDMTPIYDIKPYVPYTDCHSDALEGFTSMTQGDRLKVSISEELLGRIPEEKREPLIAVLARDVRSSSKDKSAGMAFAGLNIRFVVDDDRLTVVDVQKYEPPQSREASQE